MKSTLIIITFILLLLYSASRVDLTAMPYLSIVLGRELVSHGMKAVGYFSWTASDSYSVIFGALLNTKQYLLWEMTGLAGIVLLRITLGIIGLLVFYISLEQNFKLFTVKSSNSNQQFVKFIGTISYAILGVGLWGSSSELISLVALPLVFSFCSKSGVTKYLLLIFLGLSWVLLAGEVFNVFQ